MRTIAEAKADGLSIDASARRRPIGYRGCRTFPEYSEPLLTELEAKMLSVLRALTITARTFRNVPKEKQEWTPLDDEALDAAFRLLAEIEEQQP